MRSRNANVPRGGNIRGGSARLTAQDPIAVPADEPHLLEGCQGASQRFSLEPGIFRSYCFPPARGRKRACRDSTSELTDYLIKPFSARELVARVGT